MVDLSSLRYMIDWRNDVFTDAENCILAISAGDDYPVSDAKHYINKLVEDATMNSRLPYQSKVKSFQNGFSAEEVVKTLSISADRKDNIDTILLYALGKVSSEMAKQRSADADDVEKGLIIIYFPENI